MKIWNPSSIQNDLIQKAPFWVVKATYPNVKTCIYMHFYFQKIYVLQIFNQIAFLQNWRVNGCFLAAMATNIYIEDMGGKNLFLTPWV